MIRIKLYFEDESASWSIGQEVFAAPGATSPLLDIQEYTCWDWSKRFKRQFTDVDSGRRGWEAKMEFPAGALRPESGGFTVPASLKWRRLKNIKYNVDFAHAHYDSIGRYEPGYLAAKFRCLPQKLDFLPLLRRWSRALRPTIGSLHYIQDNDQGYADLDLGLKHAPAIKRIGWATVFGGAFTESFPEPALRKVGFAVERVDDLYILQLTDALADVKNDHAAFDTRRQEAQAILFSK